MDATHDAIVIGAGQAGPPVATHLAGKGKRVALVEAKHVGGTCLNSGCRPTKALRASARIAHLARTGADHGVHAEVSFDLAQAMARKDALIAGWRDGYADHLQNMDNLDLIMAEGRFNGTSNGVHGVQAGDRALAAELVILDVGARAFVPPIAGLDQVPFLNNESILALDQLPEHLVVLGGSYIGLEFGQMFHRFGSQVTILEGSPRLALREDEDISASIRELLEREGLTVHTEAKVTAVAGTTGAIELTVEGAGTVRGTHLLVATGRQQNTDRLALDQVGLETDERGRVQTDGVFATAVPGIVALGDINGRGAFTHTAYQDYEIYVDHYDGGSRTADDRIITYAMFTDPPLGRVGMTEAEVRASGKPALVATYPMNRLTRAVLDGETDGMVKIVVDAETDRFLGAACLGLAGDEIVQVVSALMHADAPCRVLAEMLPVHPTVAEFFPTILQRLKPLD